MFNLNQKTAEYLKQYFLWLDAKYYYLRQNKMVKFKTGSVASYKNYMLMAVEDLGIDPKFLKEKSVGIVKSMIKSLKATPSFQRRSPKMQSDILSAMAAFVSFKTIA